MIGQRQSVILITKEKFGIERLFVIQKRKKHSGHIQHTIDWQEPKAKKKNRKKGSTTTTTTTKTEVEEKEKNMLMRLKLQSNLCLFEIVVVVFFFALLLFVYFFGVVVFLFILFFIQFEWNSKCFSGHWDRKESAQAKVSWMLRFVDEFFFFFLFVFVVAMEFQFFENDKTVKSIRQRPTNNKNE